MINSWEQNHKKTSMTAAAELTEFLEKANALIRLAFEQGFELTPELARENMARLAQYSPATIPMESVLDRQLKLTDRLIPVRIYRPGIKKLPVLVYFHGGGHMCGSIEIYDSIARRLAHCSKHIVVSVDYRLAPEFTYPSGVEDACAVVSQLDEVLKDTPHEKDKVSIGGDSAGGAMAASIVQRLEGPLNKLLLIYPSLDYTLSSDSYDKFAQGYLLETSRIAWYFDHYLTTDVDRMAASPLFFSDLDRFPETLIIAAGLDPLVDEGRKFHEKLIQSGISCEYHCEADLIHAFMNLGALLPDHMARVEKRVADFFL